MGVFTREDLKRFQAESLGDKFQRSLAKVGEWYQRWNNEVYVSFSGGKDSTVLADICARWCKITNAILYLVFVNTGLEYPEIRKHVEFFAQWLRDRYEIEVVLEIFRPEMRFDEVIQKYGYPLISKEISQSIYEGRGKPSTRSYQKFVEGSKVASRWKGQFSLAKWKPLLDSDIPIAHHCCGVMKKKPLKKYEKKTGRKPLIATLAEESRLRATEWMKHGCNAFDNVRPLSVPMSFWTEQDVLKYIRDESLPIASVYGEIVEQDGKLVTTGCERTGCMFCAFGCHLEKSPTRFERLKETHPRQYEYCIGGGEYAWSAKVKTSSKWRAFNFVKENGEKMSPDEIESFVETHRTDEKYMFSKVWVPNRQGLGMGHIFDELNYIYGEGFVRYMSRSEWLDRLLGGDDG